MIKTRQTKINHVMDSILPGEKYPLHIKSNYNYNICELKSACREEDSAAGKGQIHNEKSHLALLMMRAARGRMLMQITFHLTKNV